MTVAGVLREAAARLADAGSESPRLDAELLLGHVLRFERVTLLASTDLAVPPAHLSTFEALIERRASGEPVSYIRGSKEFYGLSVAVDARALIPRPETELIVDLALTAIRQRLTESPNADGGRPYLVWDVGTGSGAIVVALAAEARRRGYDTDVRFRASDASSEALALAIENAVGHGVADAIEFETADLADVSSATADLIVANLPYVPTGEMQMLPAAAHFEPVTALDGGTDGLVVIRRLLDQLPHALRRDGAALLEIGAGQAEAVRAYAGERLPGWFLAIHADLAGVPRVVDLTRPTTA